MAQAKKFTGLSDKELNEAIQAPTVRRALRARAAIVLPRVKAIAYSAGAVELAQALEVREGTRPGIGARGGLQRPYARVRAQLTDQMRKKDRGAKLSRRQIMRRGAGS